jgi:uncharacterized protein with GYD domain
MAKYALLGGYTEKSWASMIDSPPNRRAAVERAAEAVGAKLDVIYWTFGEDDFLVILDAPDDATAGAIAVGVGSTGALRNLRTIKLITGDELVNLLGKAKAVTAAYVPPGQRAAVGVG